MAELLAASGTSRRVYLTGVLVATVVPLFAVAALAPAAGAKPGTALVWLLFVGSSVHVGSTAWFYTVREVRVHMAQHPARYLAAPAVLVGAGAATAALLGAHRLTYVLLAFFAWQFFHFQKQNLGVAALAARARATPAPFWKG